MSIHEMWADFFEAELHKDSDYAAKMGELLALAYDELATATSDGAKDVRREIEELFDLRGE